MESQVSPSNIEKRAEALATKPAEEVVVAPVVPEVKAPEVKAPEVKAPEVKAPEVKAPEVKAPNDPVELRKWATKASQESAALRDEVKALKSAIDKLSKKPVDYKELAKDPDSIKKQIELERQEAIAEMQDKLQEATTRAVAQETTVERIKREQDVTNYPEWKRVFPLIQNLAANTDGRINFNQSPAVVLDSLYELALQLAPASVVPPVVVAPVVPAAPAITQAEIDAKIAAAEKLGFEKAQQALRDEQNGGGIGSAGKGGRRSSGTSKEALQTMPLGDLKKLISQE